MNLIRATRLLARATRTAPRVAVEQNQANESEPISNLFTSSPNMNTSAEAPRPAKEIIFQPKFDLNLASTNETSETTKRFAVQYQAGAVSQVKVGLEISPATRIANINMAEENVAMKFANMTENFLPQKAKIAVPIPTPRVTARNPSSLTVLRFVETNMLPATTMIALAPMINHC